MASLPDNATELGPALGGVDDPGIGRFDIPEEDLGAEFAGGEAGTEGFAGPMREALRSFAWKYRFIASLSDKAVVDWPSFGGVDMPLGIVPFG
jgi:hypothetical protein